MLLADAPTGRPGSTFLLVGTHLTPQSLVELQINGRVVGTVRANNLGQIHVALQTEPDALAGQYRITATERQLPTEPASAVIYTLGAEYALRSVGPNEAVQIQVSASIQPLLPVRLWLPQLMRP